MESPQSALASEELLNQCRNTIDVFVAQTEVHWKREQLARRRFSIGARARCCAEWCKIQVASVMHTRINASIIQPTNETLSSFGFDLKEVP